MTFVRNVIHTTAKATMRKISLCFESGAVDVKRRSKLHGADAVYTACTNAFDVDSEEKPLRRYN